MKQYKLNSLFNLALNHAEKHEASELEWARSIGPNTFSSINVEQFLYQYCWVVYAAGFRASTLKQKFPSLKLAYKDFDIKKLSKMDTANSALKIINHKLKASSFLKGTKAINDEGFEQYKKRLTKEGIDALTELPYIGEITKKHLAKNIGLADVAKDDIWLERIREYADASNVDQLTAYLSEESGETEHVVDVVLWRYCVDKGLPEE